MTMERAEGFIKHWKRTPPLGVMVTAIGEVLGIELKGDGGSAGPTAEAAPRPPQRTRTAGEYIEGFASAGLPAERLKKHG